jgi:hypothetical protein
VSVIYNRLESSVKVFEGIASHTHTHTQTHTHTHRHTHAHRLPELRSSYAGRADTCLKWVDTHGHLTCIQGSAAEIETQTHRNLIGRSTPVPSPVSSPNSVRSPSSILLRFHSRQEKFGTLLKQVIWFSYFLFKSLKCEIA